MRKVDRGRVEVERNGQNDNQANGMRPDVHRLVGEVESRLDAVDLVFGKPIAPGDMGIDSPWVW